MDRVFESGAAASPPAAPASPSTGYATAGNPSTGTPPTKPGPHWYHMVTEELRALVESGGLTPDHLSLNQLAKAVQAGGYRKATAAGTADAITGSFTPAIAALTDGMTLYVRAASANATATPTFTPASGTIAAKTIVKGAGAALAAGDIAGAGHWLALQYDATLDKWVLMNPASAVAAFGFGQTWQVVTGSRAANTTYTNTTGRPIGLSISINSMAAAATAAFKINGTVHGSSLMGGTGSAFGPNMTFVVPPGATYVLETTGTMVISSWSELR